jgi:hypothetical protein
MAGEEKRQAMQRCPMRQTVMMAHHFNAGVLRQRSDSHAEI